MMTFLIKNILAFNLLFLVLVQVAFADVKLSKISTTYVLGYKPQTIDPPSLSSSQVKQNIKQLHLKQDEQLENKKAVEEKAFKKTIPSKGSSSVAQKKKQPVKNKTNVSSKKNPSESIKGQHKATAKKPAQNKIKEKKVDEKAKNVEKTSVASTTPVEPSTKKIEESQSSKSIAPSTNEKATVPPAVSPPKVDDVNPNPTFTLYPNALERPKPKEESNPKTSINTKDNNSMLESETSTAVKNPYISTQADILERNPKPKSQNNNMPKEIDLDSIPKNYLVPALEEDITTPADNNGSNQAK